MQHGPASTLKLVYSLSPNEGGFFSEDFRKHVPLPPFVLAENKKSQQIYIKSGYKNVKILNRIPRLFYLKKIKINKLRNKVYIAGGLHDKIEFYESILQRIKLPPKQKIFVKPHPLSKNLMNKITNKQVILTKKPTEKILQEAKTLIFSYSSVGDEAKSLGIKTVRVSLPGTINESW